MGRGTVVILAAGAVLLFLSVLFPPWVVYNRGAAAVTELPYGYGFLFTTPEPENPNVSIRVDFFTLLIEWLVLALAVALGLWWQRRKVASRGKAQEEKTPAAK